MIEKTPQRVRVRYVICDEATARVHLKGIDFGESTSKSDKKDQIPHDTKGVAPNGVINSLVATDGVLQDANVNDLNAIKTYYASLGAPGVTFRCAPPTLSPERWTACIILMSLLTALVHRR